MTTDDNWIVSHKHLLIANQPPAEWCFFMGVFYTLGSSNMVALITVKIISYRSLVLLSYCPMSLLQL